jgi:ubiquinone/menaquinone biosynthesis C-methylase UbiE
MPSYQETYAQHAGRYDELVAHEDRHRTLAAFLSQALGAKQGLGVELGCGTGRLTRLLAPSCHTLRAYDASAHMVAFAQQHCALNNVTYGVADNAQLPEADGVAEVVAAGWTLGHVTGFFPEGWQAHARAALREMQRVAKPGATLIIFETLGTCTETAAPPNERLQALYELFETEFGFQRTVLDTSYQFPSVQEAAQTLGFFFGAPMQAKVLTRASSVIPEWTAAFVRR